MGSIGDAASTSSESSSSSLTCQGTGSSTHHRRSKRKSHLSPSVASLRSRFEGLEPRPDDGRPAADKQATAGALNRRGGSGEGISGSSEVAAAVDDRKSKRQSTSARPVAVSRSSAARRSLGAGSTQPAVHHGRPVIPLSKRNQEPELRRSQRDDQDCCGQGNSGIESILKKDRAQMISTDLRSLSSDRTRQRRQDINASGRGGGPRKSNDCGNSRRVLFKNNVSVYCFDAESPQAQNCAVSGPSRRPTRENGVRSNVHSHETVTRPPTSTSSHAVFDNRRGRRPAASELDNRHVDRQLISPQRWSDEYVADNSITQSSSTDVVVNFEVYVDHQRGNHRLYMSVSLPTACRHVDADRLLVKANRSGTRIRVVSEQSRRCRRHRDDDVEELDEQFTLPVVVDPYGVTARLERDRVLVIEAPVVIL